MDALQSWSRALSKRSCARDLNERATLAGQQRREIKLWAQVCRSKNLPLSMAGALAQPYGVLCKTLKSIELQTAIPAVMSCWYVLAPNLAGALTSEDHSVLFESPTF